MSEIVVKVSDTTLDPWAGFPGKELVHKGIRDLLLDTELSSEAALLLIASTRLKNAGIRLPPAKLPPGRSAESILFESLQKSNPETAYGNYRSLKATLDSFIRCLENQEKPTESEEVQSATT